MRTLATLFLGLLAGPAAAFDKRELLQQSLTADLQHVLDRASAFRLGGAFSLGAALADGTVISLASGYSDERRTQRASTNSTFAFGSATKMITAVAVMRLVEAGLFSLDDKIVGLIDSWVRAQQAWNGTGLEGFFGAAIRNVTVRELLSMRSGLADFDNKASRDYQLSNPHEDVGPLFNLAFIADPKFLCAPGTCGAYSSTNYELLGMLLATFANATAWDAYDQRSAFPRQVLHALPALRFAVHGTCGSYPGMVHGIVTDGGPTERQDVFGLSCTNGWTCGNIVSNGATMAALTRLIFETEQIISHASLILMTTMTPLDTGFLPGMPYGLGMMDNSRQAHTAPGEYIGHAGMTYSFSSFVGHVAELNASLAIVTNVEFSPTLIYAVSRSIQTIRSHVMGAAQRAQLDEPTATPAEVETAPAASALAQRFVRPADAERAHGWSAEHMVEDQVEEADAVPGPCCQTCAAGQAKYYSVPNPDEPNPECGECCLKPSRYPFWKLFEPKLRSGGCAAQGFTVYRSTEKDGIGPLAVTNDRYVRP